MNQTYKENERSFIADITGQLQELDTEISERNSVIARNDEYIYGNGLQDNLDIPTGHDFTPVNWLRRTVEIHTAQFIGKGFSFDSSYESQDLNNAGDDDQLKQRIKIENDKEKEFAQERRKLCESINRENGGEELWMEAAKNASAVGTAVIKAWYDKEEKKYNIEQVESIENFYAIWNKDNYRTFDACAFVYQISKNRAIKLYGVDENVETSDIGNPLSTFDNSPRTSDSNQQMVTIIEITGLVDGWKSKDGIISRCNNGQETPINAVLVGDKIYQIIDDEQLIPKYYILPNKIARKRPWGIPDITESAIDINATYIEALSDWRTVAAKVNFPKWKGYGFPFGSQIPKPKPRKVEILPLTSGQDIQPMSVNQSGTLGENDFPRQLTEMENQFVREVGISRQLFDIPDENGNSNPAMITAMKSVSDITNNKRKIWEPIIRQIFEDALRTISSTDKNIAKITDGSWNVKVSFPSALNADDPTYHSMKLNQFNTGLLSVQSFLEDIGYDKQELDRIRSDMEDPLTASIHGRALTQLALMKIQPPQQEQQPQPKVSINLKGDMTPEQEANLAYQQGFNNGPFGQTAGPQGNYGTNAQSNVDNKGYITGNKNSAGTAVEKDANGNPVTPMGAGVVPPQQQQQQGQLAGQQNPALINQPGMNTSPGAGIMSQPGTGATPVSAQGAINQANQQGGQ